MRSINKYIRVIISSVMVACLVGYIYFELTASSRASENLSQIKHVDDLALPVYTLDGDTVNFNKLETKKILINFWAPWCKPCLEEFPLLEEVYQSTKDHCAFIMVSDEPLQDLIEFRQKSKYSFTFAHTTKSLIPLVGGFPATLLLDQNLNVVYSKLGAIDHHEMNALIDQIIKDNL